jgi:valine dehydrogenase (NAD+)
MNIVITGAARGIGAATATRLAASGHRVALGDLDTELVQGVAEDLAGAVSAHLDVTSPDSWREFLAATADVGPIDVYSPCALGDALTDDVVRRLTARVVCGAANNQLAHPGVEKQLADRGILYAPDYVVNSGGLIQVADELDGFDFERAERRASRIFETTREVFEVAAADGAPPAVAADRIAEQRMAAAPGAGRIWLPPDEVREG